MKEKDIEWNKATNPAWQYSKKEKELLIRAGLKFPEKETLYDGSIYTLDKIFNDKTKAWNYVMSGDGDQRVEERNGKYAVYSGKLHKKRKTIKRRSERYMNGRLYQLITFSFKKSTVQNLAKHYNGRAYFRIIPGKLHNKTVYRFYLATSN